MIRPVIASLVCALVAATAGAQTVEVRQNVSVQKDIAKPAFLIATFPADGPATYEIGVGLLANLTPRREATQMIFDGLLDYQRNTATDAPQDMLKAGVSGEYQLRPIDPSNPAGGHTNSGLISFRANFDRDRIAQTSGLQEAVYYTHVFVGRHGAPMPNLPYRFGQALELEYVPTAGIELDHALSGPTPDTTGSTARSVVQVNVSAYPAPVSMNLNVELLAGFAWRYDLRTPAAIDRTSHTLFTAEANYYAVRTTHTVVGLGVSYLNGEDPDEGFAHQQYWQVAVKLRVK